MTDLTTHGTTEIIVRPMKEATIAESDVVQVSPQKGILTAHSKKSCPNKENCFDCKKAYHLTPCHYKNIKQRVSCFNHAAIPARFHSATLGGLEQSLDEQAVSASMKQAIRWLLAWIARESLPSKGMVLLGGNGMGKTFLMAALVRYLTLVCAIPCLLLDCGHFLAQLKRCFNSTKDEHKLMESICDIDVLVLDDLGSTRQSQWSSDVFKHIIAKRYNAVAPTFITTPFEQRTDLQRWLSEHSHSRLQEMCYFINIIGKDQRYLNKSTNHLKS